MVEKKEKKIVEKKTTAKKPSTPKKVAPKKATEKKVVVAPVAEVKREKAIVETIKRTDRNLEKELHTEKMGCCKASYPCKKALIWAIFLLLGLGILCSLWGIKKKLKAIDLNIQELHQRNLAEVGGEENYRSIKRVYQTPEYQGALKAQIQGLEASIFETETPLDPQYLNIEG